ncbi:hypothetical protein Prudu_016439 [Prunus dulcis]|uniref:Fatty acyl-CoA reductase n=1 Tax=Prunus dulcis TaxID=3755 RepID=A0A4Y1RM26_PRUDU|nr:hypothetical protein Prudu_016439 [Prunus dulcis]
MDTKSATDRMHNQIIRKELFKVLREKWGAEFDSFIAKKVVAVPGDVTFDDLGVKEFKLREEMCTDIEIILNSAGTTNFDERYDIALSVNTFGVQHVLSFAKKCLKLEILLHLIYVVKGKDLYQRTHLAWKRWKRRSLNLISKCKRRSEKLNELKAQNVTEEVITTTMKNFGIERAKLYGWPNTYVFTKAMGEILLRHSKDNLSVVIIRPTVVTVLTKSHFQVGSKVPVDMVDGKPVKVGKLNFKTMATFRMYMQIRFMLPLKGLKFVNKAFGEYFQDLFDDNNAEDLRRITREKFRRIGNFQF